MTDRSNPSIFRAEALQRYVQQQEKQVLPRFISPRSFVLLWVVLGLLGVAVGLAWLSRIPVYTSGSAAVVNEGEDGYGGAFLVAFFPPDSLPQLREGQALLVRLGREGQHLPRPIIEVAPEILSPEVARERFGLDSGTALVVDQPAAVAIAELEPVPAGLPASSYAGSVLRADVEVGSRRVLSLFKSTLPGEGD
jgi:hypothetical protein